VDDSGDIAADEGDYDFPYREITADIWLSSDELLALRSEWSLDPERSEPNLGFLMADPVDGMPRLFADERHTAEGDDWNVGGWTPVMFADISIIGPDAVPAE
jgi:hypothetical protein